MRFKKILPLCCSACLLFIQLHAQTILTNIAGRKITSLNGKWQIMIDPSDAANSNWSPAWKEKVIAGKYDFYERGFTESNTLDVPGDWNSQRTELKYYESTIWYKKVFNYQLSDAKKLFLYFGAANYITDVYINSEKAGSHEGGFTPFQFDITDKVKPGDNTIIIRVNNKRLTDAIPAMGYDWWNFGGITRDVSLIETPPSYIEDYFIQLKKSSITEIEGWLQLKGEMLSQKISIAIPELKINYTAQTNADGKVLIRIKAKPILWSTSNPKLYNVSIKAATDSIRENIGFRNIEVKETDILLNGKSVFLKGINIHEEIPQRGARAWSEADANYLLDQAIELGCNFVRLVHYPHNENIVRLADKKGLLVWEEIPLWQGIQFSNPDILKKANNMLQEMIARDKNRCAVILWSLSNETTPSESRNQTLTDMAKFARTLDPTRLITSAFNHVQYDKNTVTIDDSLSKQLDVLAVNEYLGWYTPWPAKPEEMVWKSLFNKPLIMSEFGGEALQGNHGADANNTWSEERQEHLYKEQLAMLKQIPFLRGTAPWVLADFHSPSRMQPVYQQGWNRKGLLGSNGIKKKAWYVLHEFYNKMNTQ